MPDRPKIGLIVADDMGYGDFGCFNYGASRTPVLDQLVSEGMCLTQHYSASPVCAPARALAADRPLSASDRRDRYAGNPPSRIGWRLARADHRGSIAPRWLRYRAGWKRTNGAFDNRYHPTRRGFGVRGILRRMAAVLEVANRPRRLFSRGDGRYLTDVFTEEAIGFVQRHRDEPSSFTSRITRRTFRSKRAMTTSRYSATRTISLRPCAASMR